MADTADVSHKPLDDVSFEEALRELEQIVGKLEAGQVDLSQSISYYERGEALRAHCEKQLKDAELRIEKISLSSEGKAVGLEPANIDA